MIIEFQILLKKTGFLMITMIKSKCCNVMIISLATLLFLVSVEKESISVPVIPNESIVNGVVSEYSIVSSRLIGIKPEQIIYRLTINIESSDGVNDKPNLLDNKNGQDMQFYSKEKLSPEIFGKKIKALVRYTGDEKGGIFWIKNIKIIK